MRLAQRGAHALVSGCCLLVSIYCLAVDVSALFAASLLNSKHGFSSQVAFPVLAQPLRFQEPPGSSAEQREYFRGLPITSSADCLANPVRQRPPYSGDVMSVSGCLRVVAPRFARADAGDVGHTPRLRRGPAPQDQWPKLYDDPRIVSWSRRYLAGHHAEVLRAVEADLRSPSPHPFAPQIWVAIHQVQVNPENLRQSRLRQAWAGVTDPRLRDLLGPLAQIATLSEDDRQAEALQHYPASLVNQIHDLWALSRLSQIAGDQAQHAAAFEYSLAAIKMAPHWFQAAWLLDASSFSPFAQQIDAAIGFNTRLHKTVFAEFIQAQRNRDPQNELDELAAIDRWLKAYPHDARAYARKGQILLSRDLPEEALKAFTRGVTEYPFYSNWDNVAIALIKLGRVDEARQWLAQLAGIFGVDSRVRAAWIEHQFAKQLLKSGEKGLGRAVLEQALVRWPENTKLLYRYARLELDSGRPAPALSYAEKAAMREPQDLDFQLLLAEAFEKTGDLDRAAGLLQAIDDRFQAKSQEFFVQSGRVLGRYVGLEERVRILARGLEAYPESLWLHQEHAAALMEVGRSEEAVAVVRSVLSRQPSNWSLARVVPWVRQAYGESAADQELHALLRRYPQKELLWKELAHRTKSAMASDDVLQVWQRAIQENPGRSWPLENYVEVLVQEERWADALQAIRQGLTRPEKGGVQDLLNVLAKKVSVIQSMALKGKAGQLLLEEGLAGLDELKIRKGVASFQEFYQTRSNLLLALNRDDEAAQDAVQAVRHSDDYTDIMLLLNRYSRTLGFAKIASLYKTRFLDKDPYHAEALIEWARIHVQWGGSPLVALKAISDLKERRPDQYGRGRQWEIEASGQLGDYRKKFELRYGGPTGGIAGPSDRYVSWYEIDRANVMERPHTTFSFNPETLEATITNLDSGVVLVRRAHPISGKPTLIKRGLAFVEAEYDREGGNLFKLSSSSGGLPRILRTR